MSGGFNGGCWCCATHVTVAIENRIVVDVLVESAQGCLMAKNRFGIFIVVKRLSIVVDHCEVADVNHG